MGARSSAPQSCRSEMDTMTEIKLHRQADVDWSKHYAAIGEFVVTFEKIPTGLRFHYGCIAQNDGLKTWELTANLLNIPSIGPEALAIAYCAAVHAVSSDIGTIKAKLEAGEEYVSRRSGRTLQRLGNPKGLTVSRPDLGALATKEKAQAFAARVLPMIRELQAGGASSLAAVAAGLNARHVLSAAGKPWTPMGVKRVLDRAAL